VGRSLWREDGSDFYICCWPLPTQSFFGPNPLGLATIFTVSHLMLLGAWLQSPDPHTQNPDKCSVVSQFPFPYSLISSRHGPRRQNTAPLLLHGAYHPENTCHMSDCEFLVRYHHWAWRGRHRKHSLSFWCVLDRVYRAAARQRVDQIRYNMFCSYFMNFVKVNRRLKSGAEYGWCKHTSEP
jgi:hypothetical protein